MSHIDKFLDTIHTSTPTTASKTARLYKSARKNFRRSVPFTEDN